MLSDCSLKSLPIPIVLHSIALRLSAWFVTPVKENSFSKAELEGRKSVIYNWEVWMPDAYKLCDLRKVT